MQTADRALICTGPRPRDPIDVPRSDNWRDPSRARHLTGSEHDNTRVVRWVTQEKGVTLTGPPPQSLIDPVSSADLAAETVELLHTVDDFVRTNREGWCEFFVAWPRNGPCVRSIRPGIR